MLNVTHLIDRKSFCSLPNEQRACPLGHTVIGSGYVVGARDRGGLAPLPGVTWCQAWCPLGVLAHTAAYGNNVQGVGWNLDTNNIGPRGTGTLKQPRPRPYEACSEER